MTQVEEKKGFSWMGLLFGGAYYAGYGELVKGLIMAAITGVFLVPGFFVHIYAGVNRPLKKSIFPVFTPKTCSPQQLA